MSIGDTSDIARRMRAILPTGWFPSMNDDYQSDKSPILNAILNGMAAPLSCAYSLLQYGLSSTRLGSATDIMLDIAAQDLFGTSGLPRMSGEADAAYLIRIQKNLAAQKSTRDAVMDSIKSIGAQGIQLVESGNCNDCGFYALAGQVHGGYGTPSLRYSGNYGEFYAEISSGASQQQVSNAIINTKSEGVKAWVRVT